ncbi:hypothetical protein [Solicola sp. PLA-1-18]|uniref:hypothetical protein n=1 Tax=Solicola sp. PLA-1-18 TaxID=3380532 RepID=UPI003B7AA672
MHAIHLFDGYVATEGKVRARCSCGFLTTPQPAQRAARHQLLDSHGLSELECDACGRQSDGRLEVGLPATLAVRPDPVTNVERLVCAQGSGGCDLTSELGEHAAAQVAEATSVVVTGVRQQVAEYQAATISTAVGVLMGKGGVDQRRARIRLSRQAAHLGISDFEAATRIVAAASSSRRMTSASS